MKEEITKEYAENIFNSIRDLGIDCQSKGIESTVFMDKARTMLKDKFEANEIEIEAFLKSFSMMITEQTQMN